MAPGAKIASLPDIKMRPSLLDEGVRGQNGNLGDTLTNDLELLLQEHQTFDTTTGREGDLNIYRSGSAPPTIQGSLNAIDNLFETSGSGCVNGSSSGGSTIGYNGGMSEDEMRSHPVYLSYYYSHENINPRLPPPFLSKEEWRSQERLRRGYAVDGGSTFREIPDCRRGLADGSSLFEVQPARSEHMLVENGFNEPNAMPSMNSSLQPSSIWNINGADKWPSPSGAGLGTRRKSFADILQEGLNRSASLSARPTLRPLGNTFGGLVDSSPKSCQAAELSDELENKVNLHSPAGPRLPGVQSHGSLVSNPSISSVDPSLSRSSTPEVQRSPPDLPIVDRGFSVEASNISGICDPNGCFSGKLDRSDFASCFSSLTLLEKGLAIGLSSNHLTESPILNLGTPDNAAFLRDGYNISKPVDELTAFSKGAISSVNLQSEANALSSRAYEELNSYSNSNYPAVLGNGCGGCYVNESLNIAGQGNGTRNRVQLESHLGSAELSALQSLQRIYSTRTTKGISYCGGNLNCFRNGYLIESQELPIDAFISQQTQQCCLAPFRKCNGIDYRFYDIPGIAYQGASLANYLRAARFGNSTVSDGCRSHRSSTMINLSEGSGGLWSTDISMGVRGNFGVTLLEEFKNRNKPFELSDLVGHVVQFSTDQCGSRFIQRKLETATEEDKMRIFSEIVLHSHALMTDVFGNYVIQKLFEHGTDSQRKVLTGQLMGHVLPLSLQMYGCRVIQKALETVNVDEKTLMVKELDGSVMKCVRDQNGNHVIQKCIECIPEDRIQFIISSFYGQIVSLSTHPYGCRVIQRVLECCHNRENEKAIMDEIMQSVCTLAQDQYGNYVVQHVLQHGKAEERSVIIGKLTGQIVKMSQQKFASNVVEKCLTFGSPDERQLLVGEMLGSTDENEPLQNMLKDPFGNYVIQKVIETCDNQTRGLILSRIKLHLAGLKKYTYVKHIVARVEKLLVAHGGNS